MSTPLQHFRKRQLLEYQYERSLLTKQTIQTEYPSSPSSLDSGTSASLDKSPEKWNNIEYQSNNPKGSVQLQAVQKEYSNTAVTLLNNTSTAVSEISPWPYAETQVTSPLTDNDAMFEIKNKLKDSSSMKPRPSTLLLAKLSQFKEKSLAKPKQISPEQTIPPVEMYPSTQAESHIECITDAIYGKDSPALEGSRQLLVKKDLKVEERKRPFNSFQHNDDNDVQQDFETASSTVAQPVRLEAEPIARNKYSLDEIHQLANRITGIFDEINSFDHKIFDILEKGIEIQETPDIAKDKLLQTQKNKYHQLKPTNVEGCTQNLRTSLATKQPNAPKIAKLIHVTADTLPEELIHHSAVSGINESTTSSQKESTRNNSAIQMENPGKYPFPSIEDPNQMVMGPHGTLISNIVLSKIDWTQGAPAITRKILMAIFDRKTLSTHSLTGRPSPAFKDLDKPEKKPLDSAKVADTVYLITSRINATAKEVRMAITTKCADECKMLRWRGQKKLKKVNNKENKRITPY